MFSVVVTATSSLGSHKPHDVVSFLHEFDIMKSHLLCSHMFYIVVTSRRLSNFVNVMTAFVSVIVTSTYDLPSWLTIPCRLYPLRHDVTTSPVLRHQRHNAVADDERPAAVDILLYSGAEGPDRSRRPAQLPHLPAQRCRQHPQDVRPRAAARWALTLLPVRVCSVNCSVL